MRFLSKVSVLPPVDAVVDTTPYSGGSWRRSCTEASSFHQSDFFFLCRHMFWADEASVWIPHAAYNEVDQRGSAVTCICLSVRHCIVTVSHKQTAHDFPTAGLRFVPNTWIVSSGKNPFNTKAFVLKNILVWLNNKTKKTPKNIKNLKKRISWLVF